MENLTKLILNNKIVEFRKPVRQSRIHCIRKLTRDIKKLREKKGTDEQKTKNTRKADRWVEEIFAMKKLKDDEISKFALLNERTLNDITNDANQSIENKALARLAHHKAIAQKVRNFRETFPEWKTCLEFLLETLGEKYKQKKSMKSTKKKKKTKLLSKKLKSTDECVTKKPANCDEPKSPRRQDEKPIPDDVVREDLPEKRAVEKDLPKKRAVEKDLPKKRAVEKDLSRKRVGEEESLVDHTDDVKSTTLEEFSEKCSTDEESDEQGAADPFFRTKDDVEYISLSAKATVSCDRQPPNPNARNRRERRSFGNVRLEKRDFQPKKFGKPVFDRDNRDRNRREEVPVKPEPCLHPSWEAKKKQAIHPVRFEGKKITFDDS